MTDEYPIRYYTVISEIKKNGDVAITLPEEICKKHGFKPSDSFYFTVVDKKIVMTPFVSISRLKREWNKYMRRMNNFNVSFEVIRANKIMGKLDSTESKYHSERNPDFKSDLIF